MLEKQIAELSCWELVKLRLINALTRACIVTFVVFCCLSVLFKQVVPWYNLWFCFMAIAIIETYKPKIILWLQKNIL